MLTDDRVRNAARQNLRLWLMMVLTFVTGWLTPSVTSDSTSSSPATCGQHRHPRHGSRRRGQPARRGPTGGAGCLCRRGAVAGRLLHRHKPAWNSIVTAIFACSACVLTAASTVLAISRAGGASAAGIGIAACIAALMGAQGATARALAAADMTTVLVTSTITAYASKTLFMPRAA
jgi:hypothetical protein